MSGQSRTKHFHRSLFTSKLSVEPTSHLIRPEWVRTIGIELALAELALELEGADDARDTLLDFVEAIFGDGHCHLPVHGDFSAYCDPPPTVIGLEDTSDGSATNRAGRTHRCDRCRLCIVHIGHAIAQPVSAEAQRPLVYALRRYIRRVMAFFRPETKPMGLRGPQRGKPWPASPSGQADAWLPGSIAGG